MSKNLEDYVVQHIVPMVPGAPTQLVLQKLRDTLIEFCRMTQCWQVDAEPTYRRSDVTDYDLDFQLADDIDEGQVRVETILYGGVTENGAERYPGLSKDYYLVDGDDGPMIRLVNPPAQDAADPFTITLVLVPKVCITAMPDELFFRWYDVWAKGTAYRVCMLRNGPWYDPNAAGQFLREYNHGLGLARIHYGKGQVGATTTAQGRSWL